MDISNCNSQPFVTEIKQGDSLTLINNYPKSQTVRIGMNIEHTVEANSSKVIKADFGYGAGSYGFSCQTKPGVAGIIVTRDISN